MSTRSDIIVHRADGKWSRVYCHFDGYLTGVGKTLFEHYNGQERAEAVVAPGDISSLSERCDKPAGHSYSRPVKGCTVYYGRDRGEEGTEAAVFPTLADAWPPKETGTEFTYVWDNGKWFAGDPDEGQQTLQPLEDLLTGHAELRPAIKAFGVNFVIGQHSGKL